MNLVTDLPLTPSRVADRREARPASGRHARGAALRLVPHAPSASGARGSDGHPRVTRVTTPDAEWQPVPGHGRVVARQRGRSLRDVLVVAAIVGAFAAATFGLMLR